MPQVLTATITDPQTILWTGQLVTSAYTIGPGDTVFRCDSTSGAFTITLPPADANEDRVLAFVLIANNTVTIDPDGSETINGQPDLKLTQLYASVTIWSDGSNWLVLKSGGTITGGGGGVSKSSLFSRGAPAVPYSIRQDEARLVGSGVVTSVGTEARVETTALASDEAFLLTAQRGTFRGDTPLEYGITSRLPVAPTGNQEAFWGPFDGTYGLGFGQDATGVFIFTQRSTTITKVYSGSWNVNTLGGLDTTVANTYVVRVNDATYAGAEFIIVTTDASGNRTENLVHRLPQVTGTIDANPNLPISALCENGATATVLNLYVSKRWVSYFGVGRDPIGREYGNFFINRSASTTFIPYISVRKKSDPLSQAVNVWLESVTVVGDVAMLVFVYSGGVLTGPTAWTAITGTTESATEQDIASTGHTPGEQLFSDTFPATDGAATGGGSTQYDATRVVNLPLKGVEQMTLSCRTVTGSSTNGINFHMRFREEW